MKITRCLGITTQYSFSVKTTRLMFGKNIGNFDAPNFMQLKQYSVTMLIKD